MKQIKFFIILILAIGLLSTNISAQVYPPARSDQQLAMFRQLIERAQSRSGGTVSVIVGAQDFDAREELIEQLAQFQIQVTNRFQAVPFAVMHANAAALAFMRDSFLVMTVEDGEMGLNPGSPPVRSPQQAALLQQLIERAQARNGTVNVIVETSGRGVREQIIEQLAQFQIVISRRFNSLPTFTAEANAAALAFMRDSHIVTYIQDNEIRFNPPMTARSPEELAFFQKAIEATRNTGAARVSVGLNVDFTPDGYLTPEERAAQHAAISRAQDELLRQLIPYRADLVTRYETTPNVTLTVDEQALIFMRDSVAVVKYVRLDGVVYPAWKKKKRIY